MAPGEALAGGGPAVPVGLGLAAGEAALVGLAAGGGGEAGGVGLFSAFLTPKVKRLIGIEVSESACADFAVNLDEFDNVELYVGAAEDILPELKLEPDVILVDPPRAGLDAAVRKALIDSNARQIIYISCDPSTLARDLKELVSGGYEIELVQPFDMFPQTFHVETLVALYLT